MRTNARLISAIAVVFLALLLSMAFRPPVVQGAADHVRWDILHQDTATTPPTLTPGGVAFASARNPSTLTIKVTGGGTWETFSGTTSTGSGTYEVTKLVSWQFARFGLGGFIDLIDDGTSANGNAVLRIRYSDGGEGTLGIGCEGPGPGIGIVEGVIATKDHVTYWDAQPHVAGVDANFTLFHTR